MLNPIGMLECGPVALGRERRLGVMRVLMTFLWMSDPFLFDARVPVHCYRSTFTDLILTRSYFLYMPCLYQCIYCTYQ